jgi:hypothetical protein
MILQSTGNMYWTPDAYLKSLPHLSGDPTIASAELLMALNATLEEGDAAGKSGPEGWNSMMQTAVSAYQMMLSQSPPTNKRKAKVESSYKHGEPEFTLGAALVTSGPVSIFSKHTNLKYKEGFLHATPLFWPTGGYSRQHGRKLLWALSTPLCCARSPAQPSLQNQTSESIHAYHGSGPHILCSLWMCWSCSLQPYQLSFPAAVVARSITKQIGLDLLSSAAVSHSSPLSLLGIHVQHHVVHGHGHTWLVPDHAHSLLACLLCCHRRRSLRSRRPQNPQHRGGPLPLRPQAQEGWRVLSNPPRQPHGTCRLTYVRG